LQRTVQSKKENEENLKFLETKKNLFGLDESGIKSLKIQEHRKFFKRETYEVILSSLRLDLLSGEVTVENLTRRGDIRFARQNYQAALQYYNLAIEHFPSRTCNHS